MLVVGLAACAPTATSSEEPVPDLQLHEAATAGDVDAIRRLVAAGADLDARDDGGRTPVMAATLAHQTEAVRVLLEAGADVDIRDDRLDNPFLYAGAEGLLDILKLANEAGADPALTNRYGGIALIPASERGHVEVVRYLLEETDVDVDHVNNLGWTALLEAVILGQGGPEHQAIVRMLLDAGADPELADRDGVTPLAHARARGQAEVAAILVEAGAER
jgi:ankyrin repeat protein